jgi:hypothetical protein
MAKIVKMKARKIPTLNRPGREESSDWIKAFILGSELIERKGRKIRNVLSDFIEEFPWIPGSHVTTEIETTKMSSQFQRSLMYEFECSKKPIAKILTIHSARKIIENAVST